MLEELPRFLSSVSRYFNIIIAHFATAQATYHKAVQQNWSSFADQWFVQPSFDSIESRSSFASQQLPVAQMMETLAAGLGIAATRKFHRLYPSFYRTNSLVFLLQ